MSKIQCSDPRHAARNGLPGWVTDLGETSNGTMPDGYICQACTLGRRLEAIAKPSHPASHWVFTGDGNFFRNIAIVYTPDDTVVGFMPTKIGVIADKLTTAQKLALLAVLGALDG